MRFRWLALLLTLSVTAGLAAQIPRLRVDNSEEAFLRPDDPERLRYDSFQDQFDSDDRILVVVHPPEIFDLGFLEWLRAFHREIESKVPYLEEVTSLVNARNTRGEADELIVEDLLERWPESERDLAALRERVFSNPLYVNIVISENGRYTALSLKPYTFSTLGDGGTELAGFEEAAPDAGARPAHLSEPEKQELIARLFEVVSNHNGDGPKIHVVGGPAMESKLTAYMQGDLKRFMGLSLGLVLVLLAVIFRRASGVVLPLCVVIPVMLSTVGLMSALDIPFSVTLNLVPAFLITICICDSIHILAIVYQRLATGSSSTQAVVHAVEHSGLAMVMSSTTTAAGLMSFYFAELAPIGHLGIVTPIGVMIGVFYTLTLLPALIAIFPLRPRPERAAPAWIQDLLVGTGRVAGRNPWKVVGVATLIALVALAGVVRLRFSHDALQWFPPGDPLRVAADLVDREFKGATTLEVLVHTERENGLHEPDVLHRIERAMRHAETLEVAGRPVNKAMSIVDVVQETHQALNENRSEFRALPEDRQLIAQELLLFENSGSDDLEDVTNSQFETARVTVRTPWVDAMLYPEFIAEIRRSFDEILGGIEYELTGQAVLFTTVFTAVIHSMASSYVFSLATITPLVVLLVGSLKRGLIAMIPNVLPIYLVLALMGAADIPLDASTLLIGSIILGVTDDDTIHFMHKFNRYYEDTGSPLMAIERTLSTTGEAMFYSTTVLTLGFGVFISSYMQNISWFGLLCSFAVLLAFVAELFLSPALMVLVTPARS